MKTKTRNKLRKIIGELEMVQNECEEAKDFGAYDDIGDCVDSLLGILSQSEIN